MKTCMTKDIFLSSVNLLHFSENSGELVSKSPTVSKVDFRTKCRIMSEVSIAITWIRRFPTRQVFISLFVQETINHLVYLRQREKFHREEKDSKSIKGGRYLKQWLKKLKSFLSCAVNQFFFYRICCARINKHAMGC